MERKAWIEEGAWIFYLSNQDDDGDYDIMENSGGCRTFFNEENYFILRII